VVPISNYCDFAQIDVPCLRLSQKTKLFLVTRSYWIRILYLNRCLDREMTSITNCARAPAPLKDSRVEVANFFPAFSRYIQDLVFDLSGLGRQLLSRPLRIIVNLVNMCQYIVVAHKS
jgi:hypothetical protein